MRGGVRIIARRVVCLLALLSFAGCVYEVEKPAIIPLRIDVQSSHLQASLAETRKEPLPPPELSTFERAGYRWFFTVRFTETAGIGVQFREVQATVRSLSGFSATRTFPLVSRVEPNGTTPIQVDARLSTSHPEELGNLTGAEELVFLGMDDRGNPIRANITIPLQ